jgi:hypothetical protein
MLTENSDQSANVITNNTDAGNAISKMRSDCIILWLWLPKGRSNCGPSAGVNESQHQIALVVATEKT